MNRDHIVIILGVAALVALLVWALAALLNPPRSPEHDIRRRTLKWMGMLTAAPVAIVARSETMPNAIVGVAALVVWAVVMVAALRAVFSTRQAAHSICCNAKPSDPQRPP